MIHLQEAIRKGLKLKADNRINAHISMYLINLLACNPLGLSTLLHINEAIQGPD